MIGSDNKENESSGYFSVNSRKKQICSALQDKTNVRLISESYSKTVGSLQDNSDGVKLCEPKTLKPKCPILEQLASKQLVSKSLDPGVTLPSKQRLFL